jgi:PAS domain S-box-containing protein
MKHRKHGKRIRQFDLFRAVEKHMPLRTALIIACVYTVLGICWIIFSDRLLALWANDKELYVFLSSIKGVIYVLASALLIFVMVFLALRVISEASNKLKKSFDELERTNKRLAESENFNKAIIDKMLDAYALHRIILDENGKPCDYEFVDVNPAFEKFTGIPREEIIGKRYSEEIESRVKEETDWVSIYGKVALTGEPAAFENYTAAFDKWVYVSAYSPKKNYFITIFNDITEIKKNEARLREYAYHDTLTGLPNRLALYEDFEKQITASPGKTAALFIIDSDNFKFINDSMGHSLGDILIKKMGERLTSIFKDQGSKIYRLGGLRWSGSSAS